MCHRKLFRTVPLSLFTRRDIIFCFICFGVFDGIFIFRFISFFIFFGCFVCKVILFQKFQMSYAIFSYFLRENIKKHLSSGFVWSGIAYIYLERSLYSVCLLKILFMTCFVSCQLFKIDSFGMKNYKQAFIIKEKKSFLKRKEKKTMI